MKVKRIQEKTATGRLFKCGKGHVLGMVVRTSNKVSRLYVLIPELQMEAEEIQRLLDYGLTPEFAAVIKDGEVKCSVCGQERRFVPEVRK